MTADSRYVELYIDSNSFEIGSKNRATYNIEKPIGDIMGMKLVSAEVPFSYYAINSSNNSFPVTDAGGSFTMTITPANYTADELAEVIQTRLNLKSGGNVTTAVYALTYDINRNKFTISANASFSLVFGASGTIAELMGFVPGTTYPSTANTITAPNAADLGGRHYLYLRSNLGTLLYDSVHSGTQSTNANIIAKIPVSVNRNEILYFVNPVDQFFSLFPTRNTNFEFYFTQGEADVPIDFNGLGFSLKIGMFVQMKNTYGTSTGMQRNFISSTHIG
jgi:hypothetical protein